MSKQTIVIAVDGEGLAKFTFDHLKLDISDDTVTLTCSVPNTRENPVTIDDRTSAKLAAKFTNRNTGQPTTLAELSSPTGV